MKQTERFNHLIEFETELSFSRCEEIVANLDELFKFNHDELVERYDTEDKVYDIIMHCDWTPGLEKSIKEYLDNCCGLKGLYHIYRKLSN